MTLLTPPALRGNDPLAFLAAVGLLALAEQMPDVLGALRLGWRRSRVPQAALETTACTIEELGDRLQRAFQRLIDSKGVIAGVPVEFPPEKKGSRGSDPMRMDHAQLSELRARALDAWRHGEPWLSRWLSALVAPMAWNPKGFAEVSPFYAPSGQMSLRGLFTGALRGVEELGSPCDALTGWRRVSYTAANLEGRAIRSAAVGTDGEPANQGAPSPTWLALTAIRMFPIADDGTTASATGWLRLALYPGYTRRSLIWPIWDELLDAPATRAMLSHPALQPAVSRRDEFEEQLEWTREHELRALGIASVFGSSRRTRARGDGPLGPAVCLWTAERVVPAAERERETSGAVAGASSSLAPVP
jgi:hypothetical protein